MFKKKEKGFADDIKNSSIKLLIERFKFLSLRAKIALSIGIILCIFTLIYSVILTMALPNVNITVGEKEMWLKSVVIIRWTGIIIVGIGALFIFLDIFKIILPDAFEKKSKKNKKVSKRKNVTKKQKEKKKLD